MTNPTGNHPAPATGRGFFIGGGAMADEKRTNSERILVLETKAEERQRAMEQYLAQINTKLDQIASGRMAICSVHDARLKTCEHDAEQMKKQIETVAAERSAGDRRIWTQMWIIVGIVLTASGGLVTYILTHPPG